MRIAPRPIYFLELYSPLFVQGRICHEGEERVNTLSEHYVTLFLALCKVMLEGEIDTTTGGGESEY